MTTDMQQEWYRDGQIAMFTIGSVAREVLEEWASAVIQTVTDWPNDRLYLTLHDFTGVNSIAVTPFLRARASEVAGLRPELKGRTAVVIQTDVSLTVQTVHGFIESLRRGTPTREREFFHNRAAALAWLEELLPDDTAAPSSKFGS